MKRIIIENLEKEFSIGFLKKQSSFQWLLSFFSGREPKKVIKVLDNISLKVNSGEIVGIIGSNGSGKSTLLRIIAGIYDYKKGNVTVNGKIISIINLGIGLKERLTMKENIFLVGSLFGMSQEEIKSKLNSIVEFSGLKEFVNTKIYQFSAGMLQRLAFSISVHSNPEILLLDEVFEVGDEDFREKSAERIKELVRAGATVVLVSHDLQMVEKHCNEIIWMEQGKIRESGKTKEVLGSYKNDRL